ncbi:MAG: hypothetical protein SOR61_07290 [Evtepia sp.]|nr:hypothetical protein [Evtepia sp.]
MISSVALLVSGCSQDKDTEQAKAEEAYVQEIPIHLESGWAVGGIASNGDMAFCLLTEDVPMTLNLRSAKLCAWDLLSGAETVLYEYTNADGFYINELQATANEVFWVRTEGEQCAIERLDLATREVQMIEQYNWGGYDVLLQCDGSYLTWYRLSDETAFIRGYEIATGTLFDIAEEVVADFPFIRANISDGICAYAVDQGGERKIQVYDLFEKKQLREIPLDADIALFNIVADRERCLYSILKENTVDYRIFVYDYGDGKETVINEDESMYVFYWNYDDGRLFLNERNDNAILMKTLNTGETSIISNQGNHLYILSRITSDGSYIVLDSANEVIPVLTLIKAS